MPRKHHRPILWILPASGLLCCGGASGHSDVVAEGFDVTIDARDATGDKEDAPDETGFEAMPDSVQDTPPPDADTGGPDGLNALGCRNVFRIGMILSDREDAVATPDDIGRVEALKPLFIDRFSWATRGLAEVRFGEGVTVIRTALTGIDFVAVAREFYTSRPDAFEFLFVFDTFTESGPSTFSPVRLDSLGTGREPFDMSKEYGSKGVLLGITHLRSIRLFDLSTPQTVEMHLNALLHEMVHCWCAYVDYLDEAGVRKQDLRNPMSGFIHWSKFLLTTPPASVMGGLLWTPAGEGAWMAGWEPKEGLISLDLYLMGLLPPEQVPPLSLIVTDTPAEEVNPGVVVHGTTKTVSIGQIIDANGRVACLPGVDVGPERR